MLTERQQTMSKNALIKKYGDQEGIRLYNERKLKQSQSLLNKPEHELERINIAKGSGLLNKLFLSDDEAKQTKGFLYYIHFYNSEINFYKIGITSKDIQTRFKNIRSLNYDILYKEKDYFYNCYKKEQKILRYFNSCRESINYDNFKSHECFNRNILNEFLRWI